MTVAKSKAIKSVWLFSLTDSPIPLTLRVKVDYSRPDTAPAPMRRFRASPR